MTREELLRELNELINDEIYPVRYPSAVSRGLKNCRAYLEQEPVPAEVEGGNTTHWNVCGECHSVINQGDKFCHECGRPVKWE